MNFRKLARIAITATFITGLAAGGVFFWLSRSGRPIRSGTVVLLDLLGPVTVRFDRWAVPHVQARSSFDLARALGWLHANDRMAQMELGRRSAFGRLSEILGERALALDRRALELRLGETAERLSESLSAEHRGFLEAYAEGVNTWITRHKHGPPPELAALFVNVRPWRVADSLAFMLLLSRDLSYPLAFEELRWQWLTRAGEARLDELSDGAPIEVEAQIRAFIERTSVERKPARESETAPQPIKNGSNSWALGGSRTKSEAPLIANDPHLGLSVPGVWYQAQLRSPEYEAMGMTLPGLPLVVIGQGAKVAWSFTNTELDTNDVFIEELSADGGAVRRGDRFVPLERKQVAIPVRGGDTVTLELLRSDIGPLLPADVERGLPPRSLAWTAYTTFDPLVPFLGMARAKSVHELPALCANFVCPVQNLVAADRNGGLLFTLLGRVPERGAGDGRIPLPAWDVSKHWRGLREAETNPRVLSPAEDFLATANNDIRPPGYAQSLPAEFDMAFRVERVRERMTSRNSWWPQDVAAVQNDIVSLYSRRVVALLSEELEGEAEFARASLQTWNGSMDLLGASALFALFEREYHLAVYGDELESFAMRALPGFSRGESVLAALDGSLHERWFDDVSTPGKVETHRDTLQLALTRAWREGSRLFGPSVELWNYGALHSWTARHPLDALPFAERFLNRGPFELPGSATSISAFSGRWRAGRMEVSHGPSMRWIGDTLDPDGSLCVLPMGQSGHPADKHYADQLPIFLAGMTHGMHWSEASIANATVSTLVLRP